MPLVSRNPFTGIQLNSYQEDDGNKVDDKLQFAQDAFSLWKNTSMIDRSSLLLNLASLLRKKNRELSLLMVEEMGKPISQAEAEIEKCAWVCEYYAEEAPGFLANKLIETGAKESYVSFQPLGVILAIMPWNYPFWQYFRFIAPNIMAGNVGVLKHASNVSGCALAIEELFLEAGFLKGISQTLLVKGAKMEEVIAHHIIKAVTLTGSEAAGSAVAAVAGKHIKKTVLELGGTNAVIVCNDADLVNHIDVMVNARFQNTGQSCIAGKRFLVQNGIYNQFIEEFEAKVKALEIANPKEKNSKISCMASEELAIELEAQMNDSIKMGAKLLLGGKRKKAHFMPTILADVNKDMKVFKEETFGPLAAVTKFETLEEALKLSNESELGLGAAVFTQNKETQDYFIQGLEEGAVFINELVKSDPRLPFGGIKKSGYGRELAANGCLEFVNWKTVYIQ